MDTRIHRFRIASVMVLLATVLGGCLDQSVDTLDVADPIGTAPPGTTPPGTTPPGTTPPGTTPPPTANNRPVISGTPGTAVLISNAYSFVPDASDPEGDALTFSVQNKPSWAQFSSATGALTGMPQLGDIGSYENIGISVSDGDLSSDLPQFSLNVIQNANGTITLSWTAPTQNEDGTALTDLAAYKFYYGTSTGSYSNQVRVDNPGIATFILENLTPATYYVVATAINDAGVESRFSNEAVKQVL